ncbi:uncharacterized protein [Chanodichthys erythropterus]|uniref:uncharacterized protein isoform X3 n=1 Tax=Chanodichthys erythropterus TaxID=933992 RepID=UPI00351F2F77
MEQNTDANMTEEHGDEHLMITEQKMKQKTDRHNADDLQYTDMNITKEEHQDKHPMITGKKYFILLPGKTSKPQEDIIRNVLQQTPDLEEVFTEEECDFILAFCIIVSKAGTDIDAAVNELNAVSETKPAVFMVLHHTFDKEKMVPDSSSHVTRMKTLAVDCLFYEDKFLDCVRNREALERIKQCFPPQDTRTEKGKTKESPELKMEQNTDANMTEEHGDEHLMITEQKMKQKTDRHNADDLQYTDMNITKEEHQDKHPMITGKKYFILLPGKTSKPQEDIIRNVLQQTPDLEEVFTEEECDFILVCCIIVSRAGTDIDAAVNELNAVSETKPAVFVVLHHTFDKEKMVPDSSSHVTRMNTLAVDCLFYEDKFLDCVRNREALERIKQCFPPQDTRTEKGKTKESPELKMEQNTDANMTEEHGDEHLMITEQKMKQKTDRHNADDLQYTDMNMTKEEHQDKHPMITGKKYFILLPGKTSKPQEDIIRNVLQQTPDLEEVFTEEECDFILVCCIIVSRAGTDIDAAVNELNAVSETKPAVFVVLHHTFDKEKMVPDSSSHVTRMKTLAVDCLFYEDKFLDCVRNREALERIKQCFPPQDTRTEKGKTKESPELKIEQKTHDDWILINDQQNTDVNMTEEHLMITGKKYFILLPGRSKPQEDIIRNVLQQTPDLEEVFTEEECDFILVCCIIVSRAGTDIDAAVNELNAVSETKPAVFMVLHHTFDTEKMVPDSSSHVTRMKTLAVDCLFYEDKFLDCVRNREALERIKQCFPRQQYTRTMGVMPQTSANQPDRGATMVKKLKKTHDDWILINDQQNTDVNMTEEHLMITGKKYFILLPGRSKPQEDIIRNVLQQTPDLEEVFTEEECDFILAFCIIVSRAGTDIDAAVNELNAVSETKPAVFMVLHHTFDTEKMVPDSSSHVTRMNTLTVDCLFYEDKFLDCVRNREALERIKQCFPRQYSVQSWFSNYAAALFKPAVQVCRSFLGGKSQTSPRKKYLILLPGKTSKPQKDIIRNFLQQTPDLEEVFTVEECDFILVCCIIVSRHIDAAVNELNAVSETKPAVFMVLHHTFDTEKMVPDSSSHVTRMNTLAVDCLFYEDKFLDCVRNREALERIKQCFPPQDTRTEKGKTKESPGVTDMRLLHDLLC